MPFSVSEIDVHVMYQLNVQRHTLGIWLLAIPGGGGGGEHEFNTGYCSESAKFGSAREG